MKRILLFIVLLPFLFDCAAAQKIHLFVAQTNGAPFAALDDTESEAEDIFKILKNIPSLNFSTEYYFSSSAPNAGSIMKELSMINSRSDTADIVFLIWVGPWIPQPKSKTRFFFPISKTRTLTSEYLLNVIDLLTAKNVVCVILSPGAQSFPFAQIAKAPLDISTGGKFILTFQSRSKIFPDQIGAVADLFDEAVQVNSSDRNNDGRVSVTEWITALKTNSAAAELRCTIWKISNSNDPNIR